MSTKAKIIQNIHDNFEIYAKQIEMKAKRPRAQINIIVGMSGGVDSSVTAALLKEHGFNVSGLMMQNWDEQDDDCSTIGTNCPTLTRDWLDVKLVCQKIGIKHVKDHPVNFVKEYWTNVFETILEQYEMGLTPNPDLLCNEFIKFDAMLSTAISNYDAHYIATGHYAQIDENNQLRRAVDHSKDQSYFLAFVKQQALTKSLFPLGSFLKKEHVRPLAQDYFQLPERVAYKRDSVGICFVGKQRRFSDFLAQYIKKKPGNIVSMIDNQVISRHDGVSFYTIGERARFDGKRDKWFICGKDVKNNILYACPGSDHPALLSRSFIATNCRWITEPKNMNLYVKVRYKMTPMRCQISINGDLVHVIVEEDIRAITSGQIAVFYDQIDDGEMICLGGGVIM